MKSLNINKKGERLIQISKNELNQLIFWADVGVKKSKGGSYWEVIKETIEEFRRA